MTSGKVALAALIAAGAVAAACGTTAIARQDREALITPEAKGVAQTVTAAELAAWGRERRDPGALVMAARLLAEVPMRQGQAGDPGAGFLTPEALMAEARALRPGDEELADALDEIVVTGSRVAPGAVAPAAPSAALRGVADSPFGAGPVSTVKQLRARERWGFDVNARAGEVLRVAAIGDGDTDINLMVLDERGRAVCTDGFGDHYPVCTIAPRSGGKMRIDIVNRGAVWTKVQVLSN